MLPDFDFAYRNFTDLNRFNLFMEENFLAHQIHLMKDEWEQALAHLELVFALYREHVRDTDRLLLPLYEKHVRPIPEGGAVLLFVREHHFIVKCLSSLMRWMGELVLDPGGTPFRRVPLFEEHCQLKDLLDHHHARDRYFLFKSLDQCVPDREKEKPLTDMEARHRSIWQKIREQP